MRGLGERLLRLVLMVSCFIAEDGASGSKRLFCRGNRVAALQADGGHWQGKLRRGGECHGPIYRCVTCPPLFVRAPVVAGVLGERRHGAMASSVTAHVVAWRRRESGYQKDHQCFRPCIGCDAYFERDQASSNTAASRCVWLGEGGSAPAAAAEGCLECNFPSHSPADVVEIKHIMLPPSPTEFKDIYVVFELMETDLHQVIKANDDLTPEHHQFFLYQMLRGLKYIHSGAFGVCAAAGNERRLAKGVGTLGGARLRACCCPRHALCVLLLTLPF